MLPIMLIRAQCMLCYDQSRLFIRVYRGDGNLLSPFPWFGLREDSKTKCKSRRIRQREPANVYSANLPRTREFDISPHTAHPTQPTATSNQWHELQ